MAVYNLCTIVLKNHPANSVDLVYNINLIKIQLKLIEMVSKGEVIFLGYIHRCLIYLKNKRGGQKKQKGRKTRSSYAKISSKVCYNLKNLPLFCNLLTGFSN